MSTRLNEFGQPIGHAVPSWTARPKPPRTPMIGRYCSVEPVDPERHAQGLFEAYAADDGRMLTYILYEPLPTIEAARAFLRQRSKLEDPLMFAVVDKKSGQASGIATHMRIDPPNGAIEVGGILFSPRLQNTQASTESMYLMMRRAFDELGYRRYEWKCDSLNAPSRAAAKRLGFRFEGVFKQVQVYKGRNRDTAWFSITDDEWPAVKAAHEAWLDPANFDAAGKQRKSLSELTAPLSAPR